MKRHIKSVHQGKNPLNVIHGILVLPKLKDWLVMLVLFMKLKVHLKKCFHNVHKEMAWDVTFVAKKLWKSHCQHCWNNFTNPKPFKTHNQQTWHWQKFFVTKITSQSISLWKLWKHFFKFYKFWNLITSRIFNWKFKHLGLKPLQFVFLIECSWAIWISEFVEFEKMLSHCSLGIAITKDVS